MKNPKEAESAIVFAGMLWQAQMVKNLLENENIEAFLQDELTGSLNLAWASSGGAGLVKLMVSGDDAARARKIVEDYEQKQKEAS